MKTDIPESFPNLDVLNKTAFQAVEQMREMPKGPSRTDAAFDAWSESYLSYLRLGRQVRRRLLGVMLGVLALGMGADAAREKSPALPLLATVAGLGVMIAGYRKTQAKLKSIVFFRNAVTEKCQKEIHDAWREDPESFRQTRLAARMNPAAWDNMEQIFRDVAQKPAQVEAAYNRARNHVLGAPKLSRL